MSGRATVFDGLDARAYHLEQATEHAAVCTVLRWAARTGVGLAAVEQVCEALGLDLAATLPPGRSSSSAPSPAPTCPTPARKRPAASSGRCGTYAGYRRHIDYGTEMCEPCREAKRAYVRNYRQGAG